MISHSSLLVVFILVYLGMALGRWPGLAIDRAGVALLGGIAVLVLQGGDASQALRGVDLPTLALLFGLMVISAQFRLAGFYAWVARGVAGVRAEPAALLGVTMLAAAGLSALLANDIVCLAMTPILVEGLVRRGLDPVPFLLGLACAANIGSAATVIGNPQNMLIAQTLNLGFGPYLARALGPSALGLLLAWGWLAWRRRGRWLDPSPARLALAESPPLRRWQCAKGGAVLLLLLAGFLLEGRLPGLPSRDMLALAGAGVLLLSRRLASGRFLALVDWPLLLLFLGLFLVNHAVREAGLLDAAMAALAGAGVDVRQPDWLFGVTVLLSNLVSNVPAAMLLLPAVDSPEGGALLALSSTLAGNLLLPGSIANLIVADQAARQGVRLGFLEHARTGVPVTLLTCAAAWAWLRWL